MIKGQIISPRCTRCEDTVSGLIKDLCYRCYFRIQIEEEKAQLSEIIEVLNDRSICIYCGEGAEEREHVIPQCQQKPTYVVPACKECNQLAGGQMYFGIYDKFLGIREKIKRKYKRALKTPFWEKEELAELGPSLCKRIKALNRLRDFIEQRLSWDLFRLLDEECLENLRQDELRSY